MITRDGALKINALLNQSGPWVTPHLELRDKDGTVLFVQEFDGIRLFPGDSIDIRWEYHGVPVPPEKKPQRRGGLLGFLRLRAAR